MINIWDYVSGESRKSRETCKQVIFGIVYSGRIIDIMKQQALTIEDVIDIKIAFNNWIITNCKRPTP
jgi:hypothetical protein